MIGLMGLEFNEVVWVVFQGQNCSLVPVNENGTSFDGVSERVRERDDERVR